MEFTNVHNLQVVDSFLRLFGDVLRERFQTASGGGDLPREISFRRLTDEENEYGDVVVRLGDRIYISEREVGRMGFSVAELFAILCHELGHIFYRTHPWVFDAEERADTFAHELGLGSQMVSAIEKILDSGRFRNVTPALVRRIQFLELLSRRAQECV